ncbi:alpha/beta fold hydrolase [Yoonia sp. BS5-3]|uniref:Alpha/beta fold hydrolase n=1 Tax=Yoonia phaeophyticola TaxID=3137369 RepID=A0ABZ2V505_9RHOB
MRHVTNDDDNTTVGQIVALTSSWNDSLAQRFKSAMNLTPVELDIVRTIVMGRRLKHLAEARGRSVGTVRLQAKQLLKKLSLNSQTELVSLYASFGELTIGSSADNSGGQAEADPQKIHVLPDGRNLCYAMAGPRGGMPALFFPALIGGITLTPFMRQCLFESDILLITVWRPGLGQSDPDGPPGFESFARHCADIEHLLDELDISACPVIGHVTSAMFACAMAHYCPERVSHVVCVNGIVPSYSGPHVQHLSKIERLRASVLRSAPKIARMLVHSLLAKIESGFDDEFLKSYLKSPQDQKTIRDDAIRSGFRNAHDIITAQSYDGFLHELQLAALDWRPLYDNPTKKITYLIGDENHCYTPKAVAVFIADRAKLHFETVENAGHLLLYQNFKKILKQVKS